MDSLEENRANISTNSSYVDYHLPPFCPLCFAANVINFILGFPSNGYILWLMVTRSASMAQEFFSLNLTVSEMLFGVGNVCYFIHTNHNTTSSYRTLLFFSVFFFIGRPLFQTCICVERYLAVIHPVLFLKLKSFSYRVACCAMVWLLVLGNCFMHTFMLGNKRFLQYDTMLIYLLLFSVNLFCCLSVLRALKRPGPGEGERSSDIKMKAFKVILFITVFTIMTYLPYVTILIFVSYLSNQDLDTAYSICASFAVMTGFVHPFLYLHRSGKLPCMEG